SDEPSDGPCGRRSGALPVKGERTRAAATAEPAARWLATTERGAGRERGAWAVMTTSRGVAKGKARGVGAVVRSKIGRSVGGGGDGRCRGGGRYRGGRVGACGHHRARRGGMLHGQWRP